MEQKLGPRDATGWIALAASPTFALMAWTTATGAPHTAFCSSNMSPIDGMAWMYMLMSLFHVSPWLRLAARQFTHPSTQT